MSLGKRKCLRRVASRAVSALLVVVSLLAPLPSIAARQASGWLNGRTCRMACCKQRGRCSCRMSLLETTSGPAFVAVRCFSEQGASAQPGQFSSDLFRPAERLLSASPLAVSPVPASNAGSHDSTWQGPSLWQRPPPFFRF